MAAAPASDAHRVNGEGNSPGFSYFSYFSQDGREANPSADDCREAAGSPSERAPGQNS